LPFVLVALLWSIAAGAAADAERTATRIADRQWHRWQGQSFTLYSTANTRITGEFWSSLQRFAVMLPEIATFPGIGTLPPVEIFLFDRPLERNRLLDLGPGGTPVIATARGLTAAIATTSQNPLTDFKIDYARLLFRTGDSTAYPLWYEAGLTRYLGYMYDDGDMFQVSVNFAASILSDDGNLLKKVIRYDEEAATDSMPGALRNVAFALYLLLKHRDVENATPFPEGTRTYLERWRSGTEPVAAFESAYGIPLKKINADGKRFSVFRGRGSLYFPIDTNDPRWIEPAPEPLPRPDAAFHLARLALQFGRVEEAQHLLEQSLDADDPAHGAAAACGLARLRAKALEANAIEGLFRSVPHIHAANPDCMIDEGSALLDALDRQPNVASNRAIAAHARELALDALAARPDSAEALSLEGRSHLVPGEAAERAIDPLQRAVQLAWLDGGIRVSLMQAYVVNGRPDDATRTARTLLQWSDPGSAEYRDARAFLLERAESNLRGR
jgi:tetratricopeptide (TPR) repeat protein